MEARDLRCATVDGVAVQRQRQRLLQRIGDLVAAAMKRVRRAFMCITGRGAALASVDHAATPSWCGLQLGPLQRAWRLEV
jgi:hypothetical protein